jgi:protocatechuate 3,4-dioxygenase beta subunit
MWSGYGLDRPGRMADGEVIVPLRPTARVRGTVLHSDTRPAAFVSVDFWSSGGYGVGVARTPQPLQTDDQGRFEVVVDAPIYLGMRASWQGASSPSIKLPSVEPAAVHDVVLRLPGRWSVRGVLLDSEGRPVRGGVAQLWVHWPGHDIEKPPWPDGDAYTNASETDEDGRFSIDVDRLGSFILMGTAEGAAASDTVLVSLHDQQPVAEVTLKLYSAVTISGRVVRADGQPVVGAAVSAGVGGMNYPSARRWGPTRSERFGYARVETDADGAFLLGPFHPQGVYQVTCYPDPEQLRLRQSIVDVKGGTSGLELVLDHAALVRAWVEGTVVDAVTGDPVPAFQMEVAQQTPDGYWTRSDEFADPAGRFRVEGLTPGAVYALSIQAEGWAEGDVPWFTASEQGRDVRVELHVGGTLEVEVRDEAGQLVRLAQVQLQRTSGAPSFFTRGQRTGESGRVRFDGLPRGDFTVTAQVGEARGHVDVTLAPDGSDFVSITVAVGEP